jgi:glycosyl transferase family 25
VQEKELKLPCPDNLLGLQAMVISLERRADRLQDCASRLKLSCPWLEFSPFAAIDGRVIPMSESDVVTSWQTHNNVKYQRKRSLRKGWNDLDSYQERTLTLSPGERGCAVSHIRIWERLVAEGGDQPLLVLEDDAAPTPEFTQRLSRALSALPKDAHVLYLGYSQAADWRREVSPDLVEAEYVWTTVAYIIWPAGARLLLSRLPVDQPVDNWMAAMCAKGELKSYCVRPKVVLQADMWNVNSDVGHSDEHYWGACSDILHSDALYWGSEDKRLRDALPQSCSAALDDAPAQRTRSLFWDVGSDDSSDSDPETMQP